MTIRIAVSIVVLAVVAVCYAQDSRAADDRANRRAVDTEQKRKWLRKQLTGQVVDPRAVDEINAKLDRMSPRQIERLTVSYQRQLAQARLKLQRALILRRQLEEQLRFRRGAVGFRPVITWLPEGTSLGVGAVVSPDRRSVRISAAPFFSSVPFVDTFNWHTGETRRIPQRSLTWPAPQTPPARQVETWHDGLRTRVGPRP